MEKKNEILTELESGQKVCSKPLENHFWVRNKKRFIENSVIVSRCVKKSVFASLFIVKDKTITEVNFKSLCLSGKN